MELVTPGIGLLFWMLLSFGIVLFLLRKFAWKPILNALREREETIDNALKSAEKTKAEMIRVREAQEEIIREAKTEKESILKEAREIKDQIIAEARTRAGKETEKMMDNARLTIENEKTMAINEIRDQVTRLSIEIAEKILRHRLADSEEQKKLMEALMKDVKLN